MNFYDLDFPDPWPVERWDIYSVIPPMARPAPYKCIPHGISPSGEYIVGTYTDLKAISHYFLFQQYPGGGPLQYGALPLSVESNASGRAVNDQQDVVGFLELADPQALTAAFFRERGGLASTIALPAGVLPSSAAYGVNNDRYVVGSYTQGAISYPVPQDSYLIALGSKFDGLSLGLPDALSTEISAQLTDDTTHQPFRADYEIDGINTGYDLLATATAKTAASVGGIALNAGDALPLVGLMHPGGRKWFILRNPTDQSLLQGANGINASRQIVGTPSGNTDAAGFFGRVTAQGHVQEFVPSLDYGQAKVGVTLLTGISDGGVIVGSYLATHPFILY